MENPNVPRTCRKCGQVKDRILKKVFADGSKYFTDLKDKKWLGSVCPSCTYKARAEYYTPVEHAQSNCKVCGNDFIQKTSTQKYCSTPCALKASSKANKKSTAAKVGED